MPLPSRVHRPSRSKLDDTDVIPYVHRAAGHIESCYNIYSNELTPLADFKTIPKDLVALPLSNGDIALCNSDLQEVSFDIIAVIVGLCLDAPAGFPKANFPFFRRWVKLAAVDDPSFASAIEARQALYDFMESRVKDVLPPPKFLAAGTPCFRPSAMMLTSTETEVEITTVEIPPLYDQEPFHAAIQAGHGKYAFSTDNEVLFFGDEINAEGDIIRREIRPNVVTVGQIAQVKLQLRLLKQKDGTFTFRELLKGIFVLHDGLSMDISRDLASGSIINKQKTRREATFYKVARNKTQGQTMDAAEKS